MSLITPSPVHLRLFLCSQGYEFRLALAKELASIVAADHRREMREVRERTDREIKASEARFRTLILRSSRPNDSLP